MEALLIYFAVSILPLYLLFVKVPAVRYYTKFVTFVVVCTLGSIVYFVPFCIRGRRYENAWIFKRVFQIAGYAIGIRPILKDGQNLNLDEPLIYVANHQSCIDIASLVHVWPKRCTVITKASLKFAGPLALIMWLTKMIFINRFKRQSALDAMKFAADVAVSDQVSVFVFPEGTRSAVGMLPFKKGAFHLAVACQFPIQPIVIAPYDAFLDHETKRFDSASYFVQVLPVIPTVGKDASDVDKLTLDVETRMKQCYDQLKVADETVGQS